MAVDFFLGVEQEAEELLGLAPSSALLAESRFAQAGRTMMIELIQDLPEGTVGVRLAGKIEAEDYKRTLDPAIESALAVRDKINALVVIEAEGANFSAGAMWQDLKLGVKHPLSWNRIAMVSDSSWSARLTPVVSALMPGEVKSFRPDELEAARVWLEQGI